MLEKWQPKPDIFKSRANQSFAISKNLCLRHDKHYVFESLPTSVA